MQEHREGLPAPNEALEPGESPRIEERGDHHVPALLGVRSEELGVLAGVQADAVDAHQQRCSRIDASRDVLEGIGFGAAVERALTDTAALHDPRLLGRGGCGVEDHR